MKRLWIFLLVGPFVGFVVALFPGHAMTMMAPYFFAVMLPVAYLAGAVPALLVCIVDHHLSDKLGDFTRAAVTALAGYISVAAMFAVYDEQVSGWIAQVGFAGAIPGAFCSLMSAEKQNETAR
jgi:hypothetical protein